MTLAGILVDLVAFLFVGGLVFLEQRRGGLRSGLDLAALALTLVVLPALTGPIIGVGGGLLALGGAAVALMVLALFFSGWLARKLRPQEAKEASGPGRSSRVMGGFVGLITGVVIAGSLGLLLVTLRLTSPALAPVTEGSMWVRGAAVVEPAVRRFMFDTDPVPPVTRRDPGGTDTGHDTNPQPGGDPELDPGVDHGVDSGGSEVDPGEASSIARVEALAELRSIQAITEDPQLMEAIEQGNYSVMLNHPRLLELWQDPRFRNFVAHVDTAELVADSEQLKQLAADYEAALVAFQADDHEVALAAAERVAAVDLDYGRILILRGQVQKALGELSAAALSWEEASDRYSAAAEPAYLLGDLAADGGQTDRALAYYNESIERNPDFHHAVHNRGILLYESGDYLPAIVDLRRALAIQPEDSALRASLDGALANLAREASDLVASSRQDAELWPTLHAWHRAFVEAAPDQLPAWNALAMVMFIGVVEHDMAEHTDEAIAAIERSLSLADGKDDRVHRELLAWQGILFLRAGRRSEAMGIFRPLLAEGLLHLVYSADIFAELAIHHARTDDLDQARRFFGVAMGVLQGTRYPSQLIREKYARVDPDAEIPPRDELSEFAPGLRFVFESALPEVEYVSAEGAPDELEPGDVLLEVEFVAPLWPSEIRELLIQAIQEPPVTLTVERDGESREIQIMNGCQHLVWEMAWPFTLP